MPRPKADDLLGSALPHPEIADRYKTQIHCLRLGGLSARFMLQL